MKIIAYKPGHDGHIALLRDGKLEFSVEAEKDSGRRYAPVSVENMMHGFSLADSVPDVFAVSGWMNSFRPMADPIGAGYFGVDNASITDEPFRLFGQNIRRFTSSHERSHLLGSYAMSPYPQGQPVYALVWEGVLGAFYRINKDLKIEKLGTPMTGPGHKYGFIYGLADPKYPVDARKSRREDAGKLMAIAAFGEPGTPDHDEQAIIDRLFAWDAEASALQKADFKGSPFFNVGLETAKFRNLAKKIQTAVFESFADFAREHMTEQLPLLISGGCGLNCDWNSLWRQSGLFTDTFVQPCANDSGSAIGTAVDAQYFHTGNAKIDWTVYAGEDFIHDDADLSGYTQQPLSYAKIAAHLDGGGIFAWVQGRYEIGPRALGNRSLIAAPFTSQTHTRLNSIKKREEFRPIAPILMEEEFDRLFENQGPSPHMLYFQRVKTDALKAVTHVDGSARGQTVRRSENERMYTLLSAFKERTGFGVLCNTSLNFNGTGFINRMSDLVRYADQTGLDGFVVGDAVYVSKNNT